MKELNDLFKVIADGKKQVIESNPGKKPLHQLKEELQTDDPFLAKPQSKRLIEDAIVPVSQSVDIDSVINEVLSTKDIKSKF